MHSHLHFKIDQLRKDQMIYAIEAIAVLVMSVFVALFLPQILFKYLYANQALMEEPALLANLPTIIFAIGIGYFVFAMVGNLMRMMQIKKLEKQLDESDCCMSGTCDCLDDDLAEVQQIVDEILAEEAPKKKAVAAKKKTVSKRKPAAKKKSSKK